MSEIILPPDVQAWAETEVAAGRADSVSALLARLARERAQLDAFLLSLEQAEAEAEKDGDVPIDTAFADLREKLKQA